MATMGGAWNNAPACPQPFVSGGNVYTSGFRNDCSSQPRILKQYVQLAGRGLIGVRADDGKLLWTYNRIANGTANIPTPLVRDDLVFCSSGYGTGAALLQLTKSSDGVEADEVYFKPGNKIQNHHGGMILLSDHVYLGNRHNNGFPLCIEVESGDVAWEPGRGPGSGSAAVLCADGHLYFRYEDGVMALIEATPSEYKLKGQFKLASVRGKSWPHPVITDGKLYVRDQGALMCYNIRR
ncbi:MAG: PQQ-binding-like beta-propeller repeat protein [Pirellulales bacterium]|nr:PQQ-binding-like beta-propeller repeat protein [Pirellulales bacterium]